MREFSSGNPGQAQATEINAERRNPAERWATRGPELGVSGGLRGVPGQADRGRRIGLVESLFKEVVLCVLTLLAGDAHLSGDSDRGCGL